MDQSRGFLGWLEHSFNDVLVAPLSAVIFFDVAFWDNASGNALQVLWWCSG